MKRIFLWILTFLLLLPAIPTVAEETCSAKAAIVLEAASGRALYEKNADLTLPQASTTKIMTALLALEYASPEQRFPVSALAAATEGSQMGLTEGETLSVRDLLYILMLKSGNDAAVVLAEGISGSVEKFTALMNRKAEELQLRNTQFQNPHGLPHEQHYTTARDLAELTAVALENQRFRSLVSTKTVTLEYKGRIITNSNKLLGSEGIFGVKTGFTKAAGRCLVTAAEQNGVRLICVTLNAPNDWEDHTTLYPPCFARVERRVLFSERAYTANVPSLGGSGPATVTNSLPLLTILIDGVPIATKQLQETFPRIFAPVEKDRTLGYLSLFSEKGRLVCRVPLNAIQSVEQKKEERTFCGSFLIYLGQMLRFLTSGTAF